MGIGDYQKLTSNVAELETSWNGELFSGLLGIDTTLTEGLTAGMAMSTTPVFI